MWVSFLRTVATEFVVLYTSKDEQYGYQKLTKLCHTPVKAGFMKKFVQFTVSE